MFYLRTLRVMKRIGLSVHKNSKTLYNRAFKRYLIFTNATVASVLFTVSDFVEQKVFEQKEKIDLKRLLAFTGVGFAFGIYGHYWYGVMNKMRQLANFPHRQALVYQIFFSPVEFAFFFMFVGFVEGESKAVIKEELITKVPATYFAEWLIYYPFMVCNVKYTPLHLRVLIDNVYSFVWGVALSYIKHHNIDTILQNFKMLTSVPSKSSEKVE